MHTGLPYAEEAIWRPIGRNPEALGFPGATALNHISLGDQGGYVDLALCPRSSPSIVLIEAKRSGNPGSAADVVGQLLKYYTHALALGSEGIDVLRKQAVRWGCDDRPSRLLSLKWLFDAPSLEEAQVRASAGKALRPQDVALVVAVDAVAPKFEPRLFRAVEALEKHHGLCIGVAVVHASGPRWHREWRPSRSFIDPTTG
jgi:hypothetical protein